MAKRKVDAQKMGPLLERVVAKVHTEEAILTDQEQKQFAATFHLTEEEAGRLVRFFSYIFAKAIEMQVTEQVGDSCRVLPFAF